ncbi:MAG: hypothetical protein PWP39_369 [Pyrococcus sp.]|uniref:metallophosphoesterase family protein n=1 Tax=Pyrococcus sp. TaxID=33866 RepID=UPI00258F0647|nr:metallophosphoesterase [Pyrococcus sp.]MDK2869134.1 hypothetical protein [Pyrococcus sp.]
MLSILKKKNRKIEEIKKGNRKIMHISDTPRSVYKFLGELIAETQPDVIIHTGDLVDDIKLERKPLLKEKYAEALKKLAFIFRKSGALVYIVPGNEDDVELIKRIIPNSILVKPGSVIKLYGLTFALSHDPEDIKEIQADFKLYGHNPKWLKWLNGIHSVNFIIIPEKKVVRIDYPPGTNFDRGYRILKGL